MVCPSMSTKLGASLSKFSQTREYALEDEDPSLTRPPSSIGPHLTPNVPQLIILLVYHLEEDHILYAAAFYAWNMFLSHYRAHQIPSLEALKHLLQLGPIHNTHLASRIFKVIASLLSPLIPSKTSITGSPQSNEATGTGGTARKKKGKQRARAFEGDEVLDGGKPAICPTRGSVDILLLSLECAYATALLVTVAIEQTPIGLDLVLPLPHLPASLHSIGCRLLVSIILNLPSLPPGTISSNPSVYTELHRALLRVSRGLLLSPTNSHVGRSLSFVIFALENGASDHSVRVVPFTPSSPSELIRPLVCGRPSS